MSTPAISDRSLIGQIAANERWSRVTDRAAATAPARAALDAKFEREVDPEGLLPGPERARRAANARTAYYKRLALKSARSRRLAAGLLDQAADAEAQLTQLDGGAAR